MELIYIRNESEREFLWSAQHGATKWELHMVVYAWIGLRRGTDYLPYCLGRRNHLSKDRNWRVIPKSPSIPRLSPLSLLCQRLKLPGLFNNLTHLQNKLLRQETLIETSYTSIQNFSSEPGINNRTQNGHGQRSISYWVQYSIRGCKNRILTSIH